MKREAAAMLRNRAGAAGHQRRAERGQILVMFVLAIFVVIGVVGLVLDGGAAYAQKRNEQNVADLAAIAGATAYLNTSGTVAARTTAAETAARSVATANGFTHGVDGTVVDVVIAGYDAYGDVRVNLTGIHRNNFAAIFGMSTWPVSVTALAESTSSPNGAIGAMPMLFNAEAFPGAVCDETAGGCASEVYQLPGTGNEDVPQDATQFNWTVFCTASGNPCNGDSRDVEQIIDNNGTSTVIYLDDDIGPLNAGTHADLFNHHLNNHVGGVFPVPIVTDDGQMVGWAYFRLLAIEGSPEKVIRGYFVSPVNGSQLVVSQGHGDAELLTGSYSVKLID